MSVVLGASLRSKRSNEKQSEGLGTERACDFQVAARGSDEAPTRLEVASDVVAATGLDKYAIKSSKSTPDERRKARIARRSYLWGQTKLKRLKDCGRVPIGSTVGVTLNNGHAGYVGLASCGSVWACPCCSAKILANRTNEVNNAVQAWLNAGGRFVFQTLTMRHNKGDKLSDLWAALSYAWGSLNSGAASSSEARLHGQVGYLRVVEVTHGSSGWHLHIHVLRFIENDISALDANIWHVAQFKRWARALERKDMARPELIAQDFKVTRNAKELADYFTKQSDYGQKVALEMTSPVSKSVRNGGRKQWDILDDLISANSRESKMLWHEYEVASKGKKQIHWSKGLRNMLGLGTTLTDEELVGESVEDALPLVNITKAGFKVLRTQSDLMCEVLEVLERQGKSALIELLRLNNIEIYEPPPPS